MEPNPELLQLIEEKDVLEKEILQLDEQLKPYIEKNLHKDIIDKEGFPREDLDFATLSEFMKLKKKKNELNNDHKALMKKIEEGLYQFHAEARKKGLVEQAQNQIDEQRIQEEENKEIELQNQINEQEQQKKLDELSIQEQENLALQNPFAIINEVTENSPAFEAGIQVDDLIVDFGGIQYLNHNNLQSLVMKVQQSIDNSIQVTVLREQKNESQENLQQYISWNNKQNYLLVKLNLIPHKWEGQGVIGCRFKQI